jgi:hypothetical protein
MRRAAWLALLLAGCAGPGPAPSGVEAAVFEVDVTPPLGHALCGGMVAPAARIADPLAARGVLVRSAEGVFVIAALDWTELRNDAYARWRGELARAAGTSPDRVLLSCTHVHDAPYADLGAQRRLEAGLHVDPDFHERAVQATAAAVARAAGEYRRVSHVSAGEADVDQVACNRRVVGPDGKVRFNRYSLYMYSVLLV